MNNQKDEKNIFLACEKYIQVSNQRCKYTTTDIVFCFIGTRHTAHLESFLQFNLKINDNNDNMLIVNDKFRISFCSQIANVPIIVPVPNTVPDPPLIPVLILYFCS